MPYSSILTQNLNDLDFGPPTTQNTLPQTIMEAAQASLVEENSLPGAYVPLP